jgi:elongation factor Tu
VVTGLETFGRLLDRAEAGDNAAVLLRGVRRDEVRRGQVLSAPGAVRPHTRFAAEVYLLSTAEGGRRTAFGSGYRPQFYFRTSDVSGLVELRDAGFGRPGESVEVAVTLGRPVAMNIGLGFAIREGNRTIGAGTVRELFD